MPVLWRSAFQALNTEFTQQELNLRFQPLTRKQSLWEKSKPVNAALLSAQSVRGAFAIVKTTLGKSLGIIKMAEICSLIIPAKIKEFFTIKHLGETIKEQIFTSLLIIFTVI